MSDHLVIYEMAHSPYCIPITEALNALGMTFKRINVSNASRTEVIDLTKGAYYQVPVLVHGDSIIWESTSESIDIAEYVDEHFARGQLFPKALAAPQAALVSVIENDIENISFRLCDINYVDSISDPVSRAMVRRHKERKFGMGCIEKWKQGEEDLENQIGKWFALFDQTFSQQTFLFGDTPVYSDYALSGVIGNYLHGNHRRIPDAYSNLQAWYQRLQKYRFA